MMPRLVFGGFIVIVLALALPERGQDQTGGAGFWIAIRNGSTTEPEQSFLDYQTVRFMSDHGLLAVINGKPEGRDLPLYFWNRSAYDWDRVIRIFDLLDPEMPFLLYGRATNWDASETAIAGLILGECADIEPYLLSLPGLPSEAPDDPPIPPLLPTCDDDDLPEFFEPRIDRTVSAVHFFDARDPAFHEYLGDRLQTLFAQTGADGVAFDSHFRDPRYATLFLISYCLRADALAGSAEAAEAIEFCDGYADGMDLLHSNLRARFPDKIIVFNGGLAYRGQIEELYGRTRPPFEGSASQEMMRSTRRLLEFTDGANIENFGHRGNLGFSRAIEPYLVEVLQNHPDKKILVHGRSKDTNVGYQDYETDYRWQRYLYGSYLLAKTPESLFRYNSRSQDQPRIPERSGGLTVYADWRLDFGEPLGPFSDAGGLMIREYTKGLVLVNPRDAREPRTYDLPRLMFSSEMRRTSGSVDVDSGQAKFFFHRRPKVPQQTTIDFEDFVNPGISDWTPAGRWTEISSDGHPASRNKFLRINEIPPEFSEQFWEHDLLLDGVRPHPDFVRQNLSMRLRSDDPDLKLFFIIEVNDTLSTHSFLIIEVSPSPSVQLEDCPEDQRFTCTARMQYRSNDQQGQRGRRDPYLHHLSAPPVGKGWHTLRMPGDDILAGTGRFSFRRWAHMRLIGTADIDEIRIRSAR